MKMSDLLASESSLPKLINTDLPMIYAYRLSTIIKDVQECVGKLHQFRAEFITKHGEKVEGSEQFVIPKDKASLFDDGIDVIAQEEIDIKPTEIPLSILLQSDIKLSALEINALKNAGFVLDDINTIEE